MMPGTTAATKLDLSKLTDEEAKHVWEVIQRDFDLRKKEEDRLGDLKTKIEREDTKRELLGNQTSLTESHCIRCLEPFKFLMNSKRQCLDCQLYICKSCSRYNKKEQGWVCDPCRMARVLRIGTLEWYHENVRARFKRFGSAKVMRSLFKRLSTQHSCSQSDPGDPSEYDTQSMPEVHNEYQEHSMDATDSQQYKGMKKTKRRLTVDPFDIILGCDYSRKSRGRFKQSMEEQHRSLDLEITPQQDELVYSENQTLPSHSISQLSYSSCGSGHRRSSSYLPGPDDSEEEHDRCQQYMFYQSHTDPDSHHSQESLNSASHPPQFTDLNKRVVAIESLLNRLEQKVTSAYNEAPLTPNSTSPLPQWEEVDLEEQQLRQKLHEMTDNISDHSLTDEDEDESDRTHSSIEIPAWRSPQGDLKPSRLPTRPTSRVSSIVVSRLEEEPLQKTDPQKSNHLSEILDTKEPPLDEGSKASFKGSTALLVELEDKVAKAAANVQNAQSEVSYIEDRIAALNAAGMHTDKRRRSAIPVQERRLSHNFPTSEVDRFVRNSLYRGSLTQRNPVVKPKTKANCAKPVMTQGS
ncbi:melanophilin isoform X2 [Parambassis ranga]|uniref:Melanophilin isoform X2 n=1 Tax=Parambassis ranga TaxID=210632 RepID=A0A6P7HDT2_9TELE|nr:melanophilin isoform X2 [Parambassis ranga]